MSIADAKKYVENEVARLTDGCLCGDLELKCEQAKDDGDTYVAVYCNGGYFMLVECTGLYGNDPNIEYEANFNYNN